MLVLALLLSSAHNQNFDVTSCVNKNGTIYAGTAKLSMSYHVENSLCTFQFTTSKLDAVSVSRVEPGTGGFVQVGSARTYELPAAVRGEPFAIVPLRNTVSMSSTTLPNDKVVQVFVMGRALVSFGVREDYRLVFGKVVPDAYETRHFVYDVPPIAMYIVHGIMIFIILICRFIADPGLGNDDAARKDLFFACKVWVFVSLVIDCLVWTVWVWSHDTSGGAGFLIVFALRLVLLAYTWSTGCLQTSDPGIDAVLFASYVVGVCIWSDVNTVVIVGIGLFIIGTALRGVDWYPGLLLSIGILLNVGLGVLPWLIWRCTKPFSSDGSTSMSSWVWDITLVSLYLLNVAL